MVIYKQTYSKDKACKLLEILAHKAGAEPFVVNGSELVVDGYIENDQPHYRVFTLPEKNASGNPKRKTLLLVAHIYTVDNKDVKLEIQVGKLGIATLILGVIVLGFMEVLVQFIGIPTALAILFIWSAIRFAKSDLYQLHNNIESLTHKESTWSTTPM